MDVYKIEITLPDGTRRNTHVLSADARDAQRAFACAAHERGFICDWDSLQVIGNKILLAKRHKTTEKRLREFECSFQGPEGVVDSAVFEARELIHAKTVARRIAEDRMAKPLLETLRPIRNNPLK